MTESGNNGNKESQDPPPKINFGFATSCIFDMSDPHRVYVKHGVAKYKEYMQERIDEPLPLKPLFSVYENLHANPATGVIICSRNSPSSAMRAFNTLKQYGLMPDGACFTNGNNPADYVHAYKLSKLFTAELSAYERSLQKGVPASVLTYKADESIEVPTVNINSEIHLSREFNAQLYTHFAFDLDGVVFAEDSEIIYETMGIEAFEKHEEENLHIPIRPGPLYGLFMSLHKTNDAFPEGSKPFKISVVTARSGFSFLRALNSFAYWGVDMCGEVHSVGFLNKGKVVEILKHHYPNGECLFFDDKKHNVKSCMDVGAVALHVPRLQTLEQRC